MNFKDKDSLPPVSKRILFEDNHLIIVNKLPSEIVQGDKTGDEPLSERVKKYIEVSRNKPGEAFIGVVHRIDRPVSGAVIFARTSKALARMNELIKNREIHKIYWAVVKNRPEQQQGHLVQYMKKNEEKNKSYVYNKPIEGGLLAELKYKIIGQSDLYSLLEVELLTGRHHQVRAQLAAMGCPIKGDMKYGYPRPNPDASIHLHSRSIEFVHPVKKEDLRVVAPPPDENLWNYFSSL